MSYLIQSDYLKEIQPAQLTQLMGGDSSILGRAELEAIEKVTTHLVQKYDMPGELTPTTTWASDVIYTAASRVYVTADNVDTIYYVPYPAPVFNVSAYYKAGDDVYWKGHTYQCLQPTLGASHETLLQYGTYASEPLQNFFPDDPVCGADYWQDLGAYTVPAGTAVTSTAYWTQGDNRCQELLTHIINIALYRLHTRIAPQNIPRLREEMYKEAISWLNAAAKGTITPNLRALELRQGARIRWGGNIKNINSY
jgi:hypothetical protein